VGTPTISLQQTKQHQLNHNHSKHGWKHEWNHEYELEHEPEVDPNRQHKQHNHDRWAKI